MERLAYIALYLFGWSLGKLPPPVVALACRALGALTWRFSSRRWTILEGLARAFPERDEAWRRRIGRENASRLLEMFLLVLAMPHWSARKQRARIRIEPSFVEYLTPSREGRPAVLLVPHAAMTESMCLVPSLVPGAPEIVTLYRPIDSPAVERYVHWARQSAGMILVSRREGLLRAKKQLQSGSGAAAILFDQSAGGQGHLMLFFDRVCSTTNLPGLLATRTGARPLLLRARREGFWRCTLEAHPLPETAHPGELMAHAHRFLEDLFRRDDNACADWFWAHKRWKGTLRPHQILTVSQRKSYLREQQAVLGYKTLPRRSHFVLWLDPRAEILPAVGRLAHLLRVERPDAQLWLLVPPSIADHPALPAADRRIPLPTEADARRATLAALDAEFPDALFAFDNRHEVAAEVRRLHCEFTAGISRPGAPNRAYKRSVVRRDEEYRAKPFAVWRELLHELELDDERIARLLRKTPAPLTSHPSRPETPSPS